MRVVVAVIGMWVAVPLAAAPVDPRPRCSSFLDVPPPPQGRRQIVRSLRRCFDRSAQPPGERGTSFVQHLRLRIEPDGRLRSVAPYDDQVKATPRFAACLQEEGRGWRIRTGKQECIEIAPHFDFMSNDDVLLPGSHDPGHIPANVEKSVWWAICAGEGGAALLPVQPTVKRARASCISGATSAMVVGTPGCERPVALLRNRPGLARRPVVPAKIDRVEPLAAAAGQDAWPVTTIESGGRTWRVEQTADEAFLVAGGRRQWLLDGLSGSFVTVMWAGDLDGDGALDLFLQDSEEDGYVWAFLSSAARGGELVRAVGRGLIGC